MSGIGEVKETKGASNGPWDKSKGCEKSLRQPKSSPPDIASIPVSTSEGTSSDVSEKQPQLTGIHNSFEDQNHIVRTSNLNVNAEEFVPQNHFSESQIYQREETEVTGYLKDMLGHLTLNPGRYDELVDPISETLAPYSSDAATLTAVSDIIVDECVRESNLRYNGARLCSDLNNKFGPTFRDCLLKRCQAEFTACTSRNDGSRKQGFAMLLAELFLQVQIQNKNILILGSCLLEMLHQLLAAENDGNFKCVCQILKLVGIKLEELDPASLEKLVEQLKKISTSYPDLDPNVKLIIDSVLNLKACNWGHCRTPSAVPATHNNFESYNDPVFYGPDGQVISEEESSFLQDSVPLSEDVEDYECEHDSMDDEAYAAYEQFLDSFNSSENRQ